MAEQFYDLLRRFDGYLLAAVGWNPEELVNICLLQSRIAELGLDRLDGLVFSATMADELGLTPVLEPFAAGSVWLPFRDLRSK